MTKEEIIIEKLLRDNFSVKNDYNLVKKKYILIISDIKRKELMSEEVEKSSSQFESQLSSLNKTLMTKDDPIALENVFKTLPVVITNIKITNEKLAKYLKDNLNQTNQYIKYNKNPVASAPLNSETNKSKDKEEKKPKRKLLFILLPLFGIAVIFISFFFYNKNLEQADFDYTLNNESIDNYSSYLNKYQGNSNYEVINTKFEKFLINTATKENTSEAINTLISYFPNSKSLKKITFSSFESNYSVEVKGINDSIITIDKVKGNYLLSLGSIVQVKGLSLGKKDINKYFTVSEDILINLDFIDKKTLYLNEEFKDNRNGWEVPDQRGDLTTILGDYGLTLKNNTEYTMPKIFLKTGLSYKDDYEVELSYSANGEDNIYFFFAAKDKDAFSSYSIDPTNKKFWVGHNNYNDKNNKWKNWSVGGWQYNSNIEKNTKLKIKKQGKIFKFYVGDSMVYENKYEKYYGNKIGVGITNKDYVTLKNLNIYKYNDEPKVNFVQGNTYYCSASEMNIRINGDDTDIITTISQGEGIKFLGDKKDKVKAYYFDKSKTDYFYKVELTDGTIGWVHGGGLNEI